VTLDGWSTAAVNLPLPAPPEFRYRVTSAQASPGSPRRIIGRVLDAQGNGLNGIKMQMSWPNPEPDTQFPQTLTGRDPFKPAGFYEFLASAGQFQVKVIQADWASDVSAPLATNALPGQAGDSFFWDVTFQLQRVIRNQSIVRGRITNPPPNGVVVLSGHALPAGPQRQTLPASGNFEFRDLPAGADYELTVENIARLGAAFALDGANTVERSMSLTGVLTGQALGLATGASVELARVSPLAWRRATAVGGEGRYRFDGLPPGRYQVSAGDKRSADMVLAEGQTLEAPVLDLRPPVAPPPPPPPPPPAQSAIHGSVQHASGAPAAAVSVELHRDGRTDQQTTSDNAGGFEFHALKAGVYSVQLPDFDISATVTLDGLDAATLALTAPDPEPDSVPLNLRQFVLLGRGSAAQTPLVQNQLRLLTPYLAAHPEVAVGFDAALAAAAARVVIVGDATLVSQAVEQDLRAAGCVVQRVEGDLYALADWLQANL